MLEWFFDLNYFGNSLFQIALFFAAIVVSVAIGKAVYYVIKTRVRVLASKSKSRTDDLILDTIEKPLVFFLVLVGIGIGMLALTVPAGAVPTIDAMWGVLLTIGSAWVVINVVDAAIRLYLTPIVDATDSKLDDQLVPIVSKTIKWLIIALTALLIFSSFGYDITAILAGLGIGGLAVAFAGQATIAEVFGGMNILLSRPFVVGDWVDLDGLVGQVEKVSLRHTTLRNLDKRAVVLQNSRISNGIITNISSAPARKIMFSLDLVYDTPVKKISKAIELIKGIIEKHPDCEKNPVVQFSEFKDSSLNLLVIYYASNEKWFDTRHEINMAIKEAFDKNGIEFAFPTHTVHTVKAKGRKGER